MTDRSKDEIRSAVRERYAGVAKREESCCAPVPSCCAPAPGVNQVAMRLGYTVDELRSLPAGANLGLGCGNPQALAALKPGEVVVDLGSGGGLDCFLAAQKVGDGGRVIGVDMTPEMVEKARANATRAGHANVEFRLGEIEHLPVADNSADVIISNCVINLSPDKPAVYADAFRVLKPGGRLAVSDVVKTAELPEQIANDLDCYCSCTSGAVSAEEIRGMLSAAGFSEIGIEIKDNSAEIVGEWAPEVEIARYVASANITARKPE